MRIIIFQDCYDDSIKIYVCVCVYMCVFVYIYDIYQLVTGLKWTQSGEADVVLISQAF